MTSKRMRFVAPLLGAGLLIGPLATNYVQAQGNPGICFGITASQARAQGLNVIDLSGSGLTTGGTGVQDIDGSRDSSVPDFIIGGAGDDILNAFEGDDIVCGKFGNDSIFGGAGNDRLKGGPGNDFVFGDAERTDVVVLTGPGQTGGVTTTNPTVPGPNTILVNFPVGFGNDLIQGGSGTDRLFGNGGDDVLRGRAGDDFLRGDDEGGPVGRDSFDGGPGTDLCDIDSFDISIVSCEFTT